MIEIQAILKQYDFPESKLKEVMKLYYEAVKDNVPYPLYFAMAKVLK